MGLCLNEERKSGFDLILKIECDFFEVFAILRFGRENVWLRLLTSREKRKRERRWRFVLKYERKTRCNL